MYGNEKSDNPIVPVKRPNNLSSNVKSGGGGGKGVTLREQMPFLHVPDSELDNACPKERHVWARWTRASQTGGYVKPRLASEEPKLSEI
jgi:hypothetical protein